VRREKRRETEAVKIKHHFLSHNERNKKSRNKKNSKGMRVSIKNKNALFLAQACLAGVFAVSIFRFLGAPTALRASTAGTGVGTGSGASATAAAVAVAATSSSSADWPLAGSAAAAGAAPTPAFAAPASSLVVA
jgi:hypothetical protein